MRDRHDRATTDHPTRDRTTARSSPLGDRNCVLLVGKVRSEPAWYDRPEGRACCFDLEIADGEDAAAARVPVAWIDPPRKASIVRVGARLAVAGRLHQRFFRAEGRTLTRLEVRSTRVVSTRGRARAVAMLDDAVA